MRTHKQPVVQLFTLGVEEAVGKVFQFPKNILDWVEELADDISFAKLVGTTRISECESIKV